MISAVSARPSIELGGDASRGGIGVSEVDVFDPLGRTSQLDVGVNDVARLAMCRDPLAWGEREHRAIAEALDLHDIVPPLNSAVRQGVEEDPTQVSRSTSGRPPRAVVGLVQQDRTVLVEHARCLGALVDDGAEFVDEARGHQRPLAVVFVNVELSTLRAGFSRGVRLVHRRADAVDVEHACEGQATEARTDDRNRHHHPHSLSIKIEERRSRCVNIRSWPPPPEPRNLAPPGMR